MSLYCCVRYPCERLNVHSLKRQDKIKTKQKEQMLGTHEQELDQG